LITHEAAKFIISVDSVCQGITSERLDVGSSYLLSPGNTRQVRIWSSGQGSRTTQNSLNTIFTLQSSTDCYTNYFL